MTEEKKVVAPEQAAPETPPAETTAPPMYTLEQTQKMMEQVKADAAKAAVEAFKQQQEAEQKAAQEKALAEKRASLVEQITSDEESKAWFSNIDPDFASKPLDWIEGVQKARAIQKQEYQEKNTAKPAGLSTVGKPIGLDSYEKRKRDEIMKKWGVSK